MNARHGAVVVKGGRVVSVGINKFRNHPTILEKCNVRTAASTHAEIDALSRVKDPHGAVIYVARVNNSGRKRFSRPCPRCYAELERAGVKKIVYTLD